MAKKIAIFLFLLLSVLYLLDWLYAFGYKHNLKNKATFVATHAAPADIIILGSSNALYGIDTNQMQDSLHQHVCNLSTNHASFAENEALLRMYLLGNKKPKQVYITYTLPDLLVAGSQFHAYLLGPYASVKGIDGIVAMQDKDYYRIRRMPFLPYAKYNHYSNLIAWQGLWHWIADKQGDRDVVSSSYLPDNHRGFAEFSVYKKQHPEKTQSQWTIENSKQLKSLVSFAQSAGINLKVLAMPYFRAIDSCYTDLEYTQQCIGKELSAEGVPLVRFDKQAVWLQQRQFATVFHVSAFGRNTLTSMLIRDIRP